MVPTQSHGAGKTLSRTQPRGSRILLQPHVLYVPLTTYNHRFSNDFFAGRYVVRGVSTFRQERCHKPVQRSHDTPERYRSLSRCGCERINQRTTMYTPLGEI